MVFRASCNPSPFPASAKAGRLTAFAFLAHSTRSTVMDVKGGGRRSSKPSTFKRDGNVNVSRTLYVTNVPAGTVTATLEALFKELDGFVAFRRVRNMCFVDFEGKQQASSAMWRTNGHKFQPDGNGLLVSYDKDDSEERGGWSIRSREEEKRRRLELDATRVNYACSACSHFCFKLTREISEMPERKTDKSRVVDTSQDLVSLVCAKGGTKLLQRAKGVEKQFRYSCELCDVALAYKSTPYEEDAKYIYIFPEAVKVQSPADATKEPPVQLAPSNLELARDTLPGEQCKRISSKEGAASTSCCKVEPSAEPDLALSTGILPPDVNGTTTTVDELRHPPTDSSCQEPEVGALRRGPDNLVEGSMVT